MNGTLKHRLMLYPSLWAFRFVGWIFRLIYGFRIEGTENLPRNGPFIVVFNEFSLLSSLVSAVASSTLLGRYLLEDRLLSFVGEELWALPYLGFMLRKATRALPLLPHGAQALGLNLLDALDHLQHGGALIINPEGDMGRDGRPIPIRGGAAWLGLYGAVPLVPIIVSSEAYGIWPPWQLLPHPRGRFVARVGKPFKLAEIPRETISDSDLAHANAQIRAEVDSLWYGQGGLAEFVGRPVRNGVPVDEPVRVAAGVGVQRGGSAKDRNGRGAPWTWGIPLLLWRCPLCRVNDALVHHRPRFGRETVECQACGSRWAMRRVPGRDVRLSLMEGPPNITGLDMALSMWYDEMKRDFEPAAIQPDGLAMAPGEELYLKTSGVVLMGYSSSSLVNGWTGREPPSTELTTPGQPVEAASLGAGTLYLTNQRLVWEGPAGGLDFCWPSIRAVSLRLYYLMGINYGVSSYRFVFRHDDALKWLTYAGKVLEKTAAPSGRKVSLSPY